MKTDGKTNTAAPGLRCFFTNFIRCGIAGWCLEIIFTSAGSMMEGDLSLMGQTSLLMFPIYGLGAFLVPIGRFFDRWLTGLPGFEEAGADKLTKAARLVRHGLIYMVLIYITEYLSGSWLTAMKMCPWDYSPWPDNVNGVIRFKFAPLWFATGLLFEWIAEKRAV